MPALPHALKFAANLSWLYTELPFLHRFEAAARDGFTAVECLFPHEHDEQALLEQLQGHGLQLVLFNAEPGQWAQGERGLACLADREDEFKRSIDTALARAQGIAAQQAAPPRVHVMAGLSQGALQGNAGLLAQELACYEARLRWAAAQAQAAGITLTIEPINPRDMPGYLLTHQAQAHELLERIASPALQVQMDLYHCQIVEGDVSMRLRQLLPTGRVGHIQIAAVPDRGEPDQGELHYPFVLEQLRKLGYGGWIGCEYRPRLQEAGGTTAGLAWMKPWV